MSRLCGIGLLLRDSDDYLEVEEVVRDGPAFMSGKVQPSDIVKAVDSVRVGRRHGYALDNVKKLILGPPDTAVTLRVVRSLKEFDVIITRAPPRTSSAAHSFSSAVNTAAPTVSAASAFSPSAASHQLSADRRKSLQRSNSVPVHSSPNDHDVRNSGGRFEVLLEYQAKMGHELNLRPGQKVEVTRKHRTGWWEGVTEGGCKGWFPSSVLSQNSLPSTREQSVHDTARQAHARFATPLFDISKAPGYGAYADRKHGSVGAGAEKLQRPTSAQDLGRHNGSAQTVSQRNGRMPRALAQQVVRLLRELRAAAAGLRAPARRGEDAVGRQLRRCAAENSACDGFDGGEGSCAKVLKLEADIVALKSQVSAQSRETEKHRERCERLEQEKSDVLQRCLDLQNQLEVCTKSRNCVLEELESIKQDPELYFSGLSCSSSAQGRSAGATLAWSAKRLSQASHGSSADDGSIDLEDDVDFESK